MSVKIYEAYRFMIPYFNEFISIVDTAMFNNALKRVKNLMSAVEENFAQSLVDKEWGSHKVTFSREKLIRFARFQHVINKAKEASAKAERDPLFCLDCGVNFWISDGPRQLVYAIPYGESFLRDNIKYPRWAEEYAYFNSTDKPDHLTQCEWDSRYRMWTRICLNDWDAKRLFHEVITMRTPDAYIASQCRLETVLFPDRRERVGLR